MGLLDRFSQSKRQEKQVDLARSIGEWAKERAKELNYETDRDEQIEAAARELLVKFQNPPKKTIEAGFWVCHDPRWGSYGDCGAIIHKAAELAC